MQHCLVILLCDRSSQVKLSPLKKLYLDTGSYHSNTHCMPKKGKGGKTSSNVDLFMLNMHPLVCVWGFITPISRTMSFACHSIALTLRAPVLSDRSEACAFLWLASSFSELTPSENIPINSWRGTTISSSDNTYGRCKVWNKKYRPFFKEHTNDHSHGMFSPNTSIF